MTSKLTGRALKQKLDVPLKGTVVSFGGYELLDTDTLADFQVEEDALIEVVPAPWGDVILCEDIEADTSPYTRTWRGPSNGKEHDIALVVVGKEGSGKSGLTLQFCAGKCPRRYDPTIEDSYRKTFLVDGESTPMDILDSADSSEDFIKWQNRWLTDTDGIIFLFDHTSRASFDMLPTLFDQLMKSVKSIEDLLAIDKKNEIATKVIAVVSNKSDLEGNVTRDEGMELAQNFSAALSAHTGAAHAVLYCETSAKTGDNVHRLFTNLARSIYRARSPSIYRPGTITVD